MAGRVGVDPVADRLVRTLQQGRAEIQDAALGLVEIVDQDVHVQLQKGWPAGSA